MTEKTQKLKAAITGRLNPIHIEKPYPAVNARTGKLRLYPHNGTCEVNGGFELVYGGREIQQLVPRKCHWCRSTYVYMTTRPHKLGNYCPACAPEHTRFVQRTRRERLGLEALREKKREYYHENREKCLEAKRDWNRRNPEKYRESKRREFQKHREEYRQRSAEYYVKHRKRLIVKQRKNYAARAVPIQCEICTRTFTAHEPRTRTCSGRCCAALKRLNRRLRA